MSEIPGDLQSRYNMAKAQLGLLPLRGDAEDKWEGTRYQCEEVIEFIERIARAEAKVAALEAKREASDELQAMADRGIRDLRAKLSTLEANAECAAHEFCLDSDHALARRNRVKARIAALEAENGRLKEPVTDAVEKELIRSSFETERQKVWATMCDGSIEDSTLAAVNALIAARAQQPSQAQDKVIG